MTRRIVAGFLVVLVGLLALVVVPLGLVLSRQEQDGFARTARAAAYAFAAPVAEHLGDSGDPIAPGPVQFNPPPGDGIVVVDLHGKVLDTAGVPLPAAAVAAVQAGRDPRVPGYVGASVAVGDDSAGRLGTLALIRDNSPMTARLHRLWATLAATGLATLLAGWAVALRLARWIQRPLRALQAGADRMATGQLESRVGAVTGPPELRALAAGFDEMAERIAGLLDAQQVITMDVSHQLRTPLAGLRLRLELLVDDVPAHLRPDLRESLAEVARLNRLVDGLLTVARAEAVTTVREPVDVAAVAAERVTAWAPVAAERGVRIDVQNPTARALLTPGHTEQVLDNLISNALDALAAGGSVRVVLRRDGGRVELCVIDDGPGMSAERRGQAFARFSRGRLRPGHSGLGLAIVDRLVSADRGQIELRPTPGGGLTVALNYPEAPVPDGVPRTLAGRPS
jgi:signal transduction histidine kinase